MSEPEWWHCPRVPAECTYTSTSGGRAIHASEPPQVDKGTSGQMDENPLRCSVRSAVGAFISIMSLRFPDRFRGELAIDSGPSRVPGFWRKTTRTDMEWGADQATEFPTMQSASLLARNEELSVVRCKTHCEMTGFVFFNFRIVNGYNWLNVWMFW